MGDRNKLPDTNFSKCHRCGFNLEKSRNHIEIDPESKKTLQNQLLGIENKTLLGPHGKSIPSVEFFEVLHQLMRVLSTGQRTKIFQKCVWKELRFKKSISHKNLKYIEYFKTNERLQLWQAANWLMSDWPSRLLFCSKKASLWKSWLWRDMKKIPDWAKLSMEQKHKIHINKF
jgi:hypothetical protein